MAAPLGTQIRERILESAAALMEERSFFDISLADIARAARISKGTLYYYYNSRYFVRFDRPVSAKALGRPSCLGRQ